jgi:transcriptional regulator with XRE-family HTH domain
MLHIHEKIKQARISAKLTQDEMAEKLGIERSTYQYWEKKTPTVDKIKDVAKALKLPVDYFLGSKDENLVNKAHEPEPEYNNKSLDELIISNRILAEANKTLAESHLIISKNNEDLIQMAKAAFNLLPQVKDPLSLVDPGTNVAGAEGFAHASGNKGNVERT